MACGRNLDRLNEQIRAFHPRVVCVADAELAQDLSVRIRDLLHPPEILWGREGLLTLAALPEADTVMAAMVGVAGLEPVLASIRAGKTIALANKETLVAAGPLVRQAMRDSDAKIYPVDSEHSAIWQCLAGSPPGSCRRIILTASGGPFFGKTRAELEQVTLDEALCHPTWNMGGKITIDSASMMNKGLEIIEAAWLFDCPESMIDVVVHPQSIIHSLVEFKDGSVMAQLGFPDMRLPIQLALTWPERLPSEQETFSFSDPRSSTLTFFPPDEESFPALRLAREALRLGGTMPGVLNAANEAAVALFMKGRIRFIEMMNLVERCMNWHIGNGFQTVFSFDDMMNLDRCARDFVRTSVART